MKVAKPFEIVKSRICDFRLMPRDCRAKPLTLKNEREREIGAVTTALIAIAGVVLGWITIEIVCKPCLKKGQKAIDRDLNPDYDPDDAADRTIYAPLNPDPPANSEPSDDATASFTITKAV